MIDVVAIRNISNHIDVSPPVGTVLLSINTNPYITFLVETTSKLASAMLVSVTSPGKDTCLFMVCQEASNTVC
jgi:hypothetical protein